MHYLDNAATSHPKPVQVHEAVARCVAMPGNPGRGSSGAATTAAELLESCRAKVAAFVGAANPSRLAFTLNATDGLNLAIAALATEGSRIVASGLEHAAVMRPLRRLERSRTITLDLIQPSPAGCIDPDDVRRAAIGASLVVVTCASNVTGVVQPWREIASALSGTATPLLLDAAQAVGSVPISFDELGQHVALAFSGHKAMLGPMGAGVLIVGDALTLGPWREGGTGDSLDELQPVAMPRRLEAGTPPLPAIAGLAAGVDWWERTGPEIIRARESAMMRNVVDGLASIQGVVVPGAVIGDASPASTPLIGFRVEGWSVHELAAALESEFSVIVRAGLHCAPDAHGTLGTHPEGTVRASIGPTTTDADVTALLGAVARLSAA